MINKKVLLKIFIIFFIIISNILICSTSQAVVQVSNTSITVYENQTTTITITTDRYGVTDNAVQFFRFLDDRTFVETGVFSVGNVRSTRSGMMTVLTVEIIGVKAGSVHRKIPGWKSTI